VKWYDVEPLIGPLFRLSMFLRQKVRARRIRRGKAKQQKLQLEDPDMEKSAIVNQILLGVLRHAMTALPVGVVPLSDSALVEISSVVVGAVGLWWMGRRKVKA
jgi:hypothetical protein